MNASYRQSSNQIYEALAAAGIDPDAVPYNHNRIDPVPRSMAFFDALHDALHTFRDPGSTERELSTVIDGLERAILPDVDEELVRVVRKADMTNGILTPGETMRLVREVKG